MPIINKYNNLIWIIFLLAEIIVVFFKRSLFIAWCFLKLFMKVISIYRSITTLYLPFLKVSNKANTWPAVFSQA